jgi:hypothetical protein
VAKVVAPLFSAEARGRLGELVYGTWHGIHFVRTYNTPDFGLIDPRADQMARVAAANAAWKLLSDLQREGWHNYAQSHPRLDWSGNSFRVSGYNSFVSLYCVCLRAGGTPLEDSPSTGLPLPLASLSCSQIDNTIEINWTYITQPEAHSFKIQLLRTGPISIGKLPDRHHATIIAHIDDFDSTYIDSLGVSGRYGYWARVVDVSTGELSPAQSCMTNFILGGGTPAPGEIHGKLSFFPPYESVPIVNVEVTADGYSALSVSNGYFTFVNVPPGEYTVTPDPMDANWTPSSKPATVVSGIQTEVGTFYTTYGE